jgi:phosphopantetheine--protein transferase-like protein
MPRRELDPVSVARAPDSSGETSGAARGPLIGAGVDAERIARFEKLAAGGRVWRHVYSPREVQQLTAQAQAARAFCAAFCAKEALCKALGGAYPFQECECLQLCGVAEQQLVLSPQLRASRGLGGARVRFHESLWPERGECVAEVQLFGAAGARDGRPRPPGRAAAGGIVRSRFETIAIEAAASDRARIEEEHFRDAEIADLGNRRVQSLAGALALKRALVALWAEAAGGAAPARPRDFGIGHLGSGAPLLVSAPPGLDPARVRVSISHTREWAYGLAAVD